MINHRNEYAQPTVINFSDHYAGALELKMKVALKPVHGCYTAVRWPHKLYQIERTSIQEERLLRLGEPDTMEENVIPEMVVEPQESRLEVQTSDFRGVKCQNQQ